MNRMLWAIEKKENEEWTLFRCMDCWTREDARVECYTWKKDYPFWKLRVRKYVSERD